jgi:hypothetical protein
MSTDTEGTDVLDFTFFTYFRIGFRVLLLMRTLWATGLGSTGMAAPIETYAIGEMGGGPSMSLHTVEGGVTIRSPAITDRRGSAVDASESSVGR